MGVDKVFSLCDTIILGGLSVVTPRNNNPAELIWKAFLMGIEN